MQRNRRLAVGLLLIVMCLLITAGAGTAAPARAALPSHALWFSLAGPTTGHEEWIDVAKGPDGSLYAAGYFNWDLFGVGTDLLYEKFSGDDAAKHVVWGPISWDNPIEHSNDFARAIAVDHAGDLVVVGLTQTASFGDEWLVKKISGADGGDLWYKTFAASPLQPWDAAANDVACDAAGHVYVCGFVQTGEGGDGQASLVVRKLDGATGSLLWRGSYAGPVKGFNQGTKLALDSAGNAYVTGYGANAKHNSDIILCKFRASDGKRLWALRIAGAKNRDDEGADIVVRGSSVWVTGGEYLSLKPQTRQVVLARYTTGGKRLWLRTWLEKTGTIEYPEAVAVDAHGNAVVAGAGNNNPVTREHAFLVRWTGAGVRKWQRLTYNSVSHEAVWHDVVCDSAGTIWAGGYVVTADKDTAFLVARYSAAGKRAWKTSWEGDEGLGAECDALCLGKTGLFAGGEITTTIAGVDAAPPPRRLPGRPLSTPAPLHQPAACAKRSARSRLPVWCM
jgi:hypothetical protein